MDEKKPIVRIDMSQIKDGQSIHHGNLVDKEDRIIGPVPMKVYHSKEELDAELKATIEEETEFNTALWADIDALEFSEDRWLVKNIIPKGGFVIIAAASGDGKSWIALELTKSISTGMNFLNEDKFKTVQGKVMYIDAENPLSEIQKRGRQLSFVPTDQIEFLAVSHLNLNEDDRVERLIDYIEESGIKVVIVDTFRAVAGGLKEEKAEEVRAFFNRFMELKNKEVALVWLDHFHKPSNFQGKIPKKEFLFGSQDKTANVEVLMMLNKDGDDIFVYQRKNRLDKEIPEFKITLSDEKLLDGSTKTSLVYGGEIDEKESKKNVAKEFIQNMLGEGPKTTPEIVVILYKDKRIANRNTQEALRELVSENVIGTRKKGRKNEYFLITDSKGSSNVDEEFDSF